MVDKLISKLRYMGKQYATGMESRGGGLHKHYLEEAADELESLRSLNETLRRERGELVAAIREVIDDAEECQDSDEWTAMLVSLDAFHNLNTAYDAAIAKASK